jgi:exopolysaccharide biosynthesis polyprenyl glycosylphosphotransferase
MFFRRVFRILLIADRNRSDLQKFKTYLVGRHNDIEQLYDDFMSSADKAYKIVGICCTDIAVTKIKNIKVDKYLNENNLIDVFNKSGATTLVIAGKISDSIIKTLSWSIGQKKDILLSSGVTGIFGQRVELYNIKDLNVIKISSPELSAFSKFFKRFSDIIISLIGIVVTLIVSIIVIPAIKLTSKGPVLFKQERIGLNGKKFLIYKFRTMEANASSKLKNLIKDSSKPLFKVDNDPRITPIGNYLRKTSIDELPQFFNVLKGDMSIVGPRPQVEAEIKLYKGDESRRLFVKPGITGLWQTSGRSDLDWERAVKLDLYYVENYSIILDLQIIFVNSLMV